MARRSDLKLDHAGIAAILLSDDIRVAVHEVAVEAAAKASADANMIRNDMQDSVEVADYTTDRAASSITITHPGGLGIEAKHGVLSKAVGGAE